MEISSFSNMPSFRLLLFLSLLLGFVLCDCCSCDTQISQIEAVVYPTVQWNTLPLETVGFVCEGNNPDCEYYQTCGSHTGGIHFDAVNCTIAQEKGPFPYLLW